jgi:predicted DNA-binding protein
MKVVSVKLPEATLKRLREEAQATGRSVGAILRERAEAAVNVPASVHDMASDLAGSLEGSRRSATNARRRFRRS